MVAVYINNMGPKSTMLVIVKLDETRLDLLKEVSSINYYSMASSLRSFAPRSYFTMP